MGAGCEHSRSPPHTRRVVEMLMLRQGCEVCCTSEADRTALERYAAQLAGEQQQPQVP